MACSRRRTPDSSVSNCLAAWERPKNSGAILSSRKSRCCGDPQPSPTISPAPPMSSTSLQPRRSQGTTRGGRSPQILRKRGPNW